MSPDINNIVNTTPSPSATNTSKHIPVIIISILLFLISFANLYQALFRVLSPFILDRAYSRDHNIYSFLRYWPEFPLSSIFFTIIFISFLYLSMKVYEESNKIFKITLLAQAITLFIYGLMGFLTVPYLNSFSAGVVVTPTLVPQFTHPINIMHLLIIILLLVFRKYFINESKPLSKRDKVIFTLISVILFLFFVIGGVYWYTRTYFTDFGYSKITNQVPYHIYRPIPLQEDLFYADYYKYMSVNLASSDSYINSEYKASIPSAIKVDFAYIKVRQTEVDSYFDLENFVDQKKMTVKYTNSEKINVNLSKTREAFLLTLSEGDARFNRYHLFFVTQDNILIYIEAVNISQERLLNFVNSLK